MDDEDEVVEEEEVNEDAEDPTGEAPMDVIIGAAINPPPFLEMNPAPFQEGLAGRSRSASGGLVVTLPEAPSASASATAILPMVNSRGLMHTTKASAPRSQGAAAAGDLAVLQKKRNVPDEVTDDDKQKTKNSRPSGPNPRQTITSAISALAQNVGQGASGRSEGQSTMQMLMMMQMQQAQQQAAAQQQLMMALLAPRVPPSYATPPVPSNFWDPVPPRPQRPSTSSSSSSSSSSSFSAWPYADDQYEEMDYSKSQD